MEFALSRWLQLSIRLNTVNNPNLRWQLPKAKLVIRQRIIRLKSNERHDGLFLKRLFGPTKNFENIYLLSVLSHHNLDKLSKV